MINKAQRTASHHNSTDRPTHIMYAVCVYDYNYYLSVYDDGRYYISRLRSYAQYYNIIIIKHCS